MQSGLEKSPKFLEQQYLVITRYTYQNAPMNFQLPEKKFSCEKALSKMAASSTRTLSKMVASSIEALTKIAEVYTKFMQQTRELFRFKG